MAQRKKTVAKAASKTKAPAARKVSAPARKSATTASAGELDPAYARLTRSFTGDERVTLPADKRGKFGSNGLKVDGKIFAMWVRGALVVKLPKADIDTLAAAGHGERLSMGPGRVIKEWLVVKQPERKWLELARRAHAFVGG